MLKVSSQKIAPLILFILALFSNSAQSNQAFVDYPSLLNTKFYESNGGLLIKNWPIFFAPENKTQLKIEVLFNNKPILSKSTYFESWSMPVVDGIKPKGSARAFMSKAGDYVLRVTDSGEMISEVSFSIKVSDSDDPFNPKKTFTRDGPWSQLAYLSHRSDNPQDGLSFNWWSRLSELPSNKKGTVIIKLMKNGKEVAKSTKMHINKASWQSHVRQLKSNTNHIYTLAELTKSDGDVQVVIESNGKTIKTFDSIVKDGKLQTNKRSAWGYSPRTEYLSPKVIAKASRKKILVDAIWLDAN